MKPDHRTFLLSSGAALTLRNVALASRSSLRAEPVEAQILPEGEGVTDMLGFNGATSGMKTWVEVP